MVRHDQNFHMITRNT